ncbi:MAG: hypothetical protein ABWX66_08035 [Lacisediminihabitans sp.]
MKKIFAALTTAVLAVGLVAVGATGASADSADPTPTQESSVVVTSDSTATTPSTPEVAAQTTTSTQTATPAPAESTAPTAAVAAPAAAPVATPVAQAKVAAAPAVVAATCAPAADVKYKYTFETPRSSGHIIVTAVGYPVGTELCAPLYVRSTTWSYDVPGQVWPQSVVGKQDLTVHTVGTHGYGAPSIGACQQRDIYASFDGYKALKLPTKLTGPGAPFEPAFLHDTLKGSGPAGVPTYYNTTTDGCIKSSPVATIAHESCYWDDSQSGSFEKAAITFDNSASNIPVQYTVKGQPSLTRTVAARASETVAVPPVGTAGASFDVTAGGITTTLKVAGFAECPTVITIPTVKVVTATDTCGTTGDTIVLPTLTSDDHYTFSTADSRSKGIGTVTVTAVPNAGYAFAADATTTWEFTFASDKAIKCAEVAGDPFATPQVCNTIDGGTVLGAVSVVASEGIEYILHKSDAPAQADIVVLNGPTTLPVGTYTVTAQALPGYQLAAGTSHIGDFVVEDQAQDCGQLDTHPLVTPSVTVGGETCSTGSVRSGFIGIDTTDGLSYFVGGSQLVSARTAFAPGTYTVTAVGDANNGIDGSPTRTVTVSALATSCATVTSSELSTLAFTGVGGTTVLFAGAGALIILLGAAVMITARARRKAEQNN